MAQGGDPTGTGTGGSDLPDLKAEFSNAPFKRGTVGAARSSDPDSANSQFFICFDDASGLNGQYTVWGEVVSGMEFVDKLKKGSGEDGLVDNPDKLIKLQVAADAK
jgi:peptidylprolyl isomerase